MDLLGRFANVDDNLAVTLRLGFRTNAAVSNEEAENNPAVQTLQSTVQGADAVDLGAQLEFGWKEVQFVLEAGNTYSKLPEFPLPPTVDVTRPDTTVFTDADGNVSQVVKDVVVPLPLDEVFPKSDLDSAANQLNETRGLGHALIGIQVPFRISRDKNFYARVSTGARFVEVRALNLDVEEKLVRANRSDRRLWIWRIAMGFRLGSTTDIRVDAEGPVTGRTGSLQSLMRVMLAADLPLLR